MSSSSPTASSPTPSACPDSAPSTCRRARPTGWAAPSPRRSRSACSPGASPPRLVADAVGVPGQRSFCLQARQADRLVSVVLEKIQVALLAERLTDLLKVVGREDPDPAPDEAAGDDDAPLGQPLVEAFRVGTIALGWDVSRGKALIETRAGVAGDAATGGDDDDPAGPDPLRGFLDAATGRACARRAGGVG